MRGRRQSSPMPSSAATSCGKMVLVPWPISVEPMQDGRTAADVEVQVDDAPELDLAAAREPGAVPCQRQADARRLPRPATVRGACAALHRPLPGPLELRGLGRPVQDLLTSDALPQHLPGRGHVPQLVDPTAAEGQRRHTQGIGDPVRLHLRRELGLGRAEPPERAIGRRVRGHRPAPDAHIGTAIRPAGVEHAARQHHRA